MKILVDACVLYPTVMREIALKTAQSGLFEPYWSDRILEEWARATVKLGPLQETYARGEIATLRAGWPDACVPENAELEQSLYLPDLNDRHVLSAAISCGADVVMTMNLKDFPRQRLAEFNLVAVHPDAILRGFFDQSPAPVIAAVRAVHAEAQRLSGQEIPIRALMKKARLPRLGKAVEFA